MTSKNRRREGVKPPKEAETICLKEVLVWITDMAFKKRMFESDSLILTRE